MPCEVAIGHFVLRTNMIWELSVFSRLTDCLERLSYRYPRFQTIALGLTPSGMGGKGKGECLRFRKIFTGPRDDNAPSCLWNSKVRHVEKANLYPVTA